MRAAAAGQLILFFVHLDLELIEKFFPIPNGLAGSPAFNDCRASLLL